MLTRVKAVVIGASPVPRTVILDTDKFRGGFWHESGQNFIAFVEGAPANFDLNRDEALRLLDEVTGGRSAQFDKLDRDSTGSGIVLN